MTKEYMVARDGEQFGPYEPSVLLDYLAQGHVVPEDYIWCAEMADWETMSSMKEQVEREVAQATAIQPTAPAIVDLPLAAPTVLDTPQASAPLSAGQTRQTEPAAAPGSATPTVLDLPLPAPTVLDTPQSNEPPSFAAVWTKLAQVLDAPRTNEPPSTAHDRHRQVRETAAAQSVAAATVLDTPLPAPTVLDAQQASASRETAQATQRDTVAAAVTQRDAPTGHSEIPDLPPALAGRYRVVRLLARGGEGFVLLAEGLAGEGPRVIKLYVPNVGSSGPKSAVLDNISAANKAHVVHIHEHGKEGVWHYEVQEYVANGSLRDLMTGPQPLTDVASMLRELNEALLCLHGAKLIHRDIKPENILVRTRTPLDLVLTDFGITSVSAATLHETTRSRTALYSSPEAMTGIVSEKSDWWSIGMILVELITGRHPLAGIGSQNRLDFWIAQNPIDTEGVSDPRWRALCRGLLVRDAANRWGSDEVGRWLAGETVAVADDSRSAAAPVTPVEATVSYRPYTISGTACATPRALAAALLQVWDEGVKHLSRGLILKWVQDEVKDYDLSSHLIDLAEGDLTPDARLAALVYRIDPALPPVWKGRDASYSAILAWVNDAQTDSSGREALFQLVTSGLPVYPHADLQSFSRRVSPAVARLEELWREAARALEKTTDRDLIAPEMASLLPRLILTLEHPPALDQLRVSVHQPLSDGLVPKIPDFLSANSDDPATLLLVAYLRKTFLEQDLKLAQDSSGIATNHLQIQCKIGHVEGVTRCAECHGKGRHKCPGCKGHKGRVVTCGEQRDGKTGVYLRGCYGTGLDSPCTRCRGTGKDPQDPRMNPASCYSCEGTGSELNKRSGKGTGHIWYPNAPCPICDGRGDIFMECSKCDGKGEVECKNCSGKGYVCETCNEIERKQTEIKRQQAEVERKEKEEAARRLEQVKSTLNADIAAWKRQNYGIWAHSRLISYGIAAAVGLLGGLISHISKDLFFYILLVSPFAVPLGFIFLVRKYSDVDSEKALQIAAVTVEQNVRLAESGSDVVKQRPDFSAARKKMDLWTMLMHYFYLLMTLVMFLVLSAPKP